MGSREAIYVDESTIDFPIFLLFFNTKFPIFPIFSIPSFLFSYFFEQPCPWTPCKVLVSAKVRRRNLFERSKFPFSFFVDRFFVYESYFLSLIFSDKQTSRVGGLGESYVCARNNDKRISEWNFRSSNYSSTEFWLRKKTFVLILPKCNENEFERKNSLSQSFSCLNRRQF